MRLFIAIPLADSVEAQLKRLTAHLRHTAPNLRWSAPESWHITLQFLGNTNDDQYACLSSRLAKLKANPFAVDFEGLGVFDRAGAFFLGVKTSPALVALQKKVIEATEPCGFEPEDRPYRPHITLARSKSGGRALRPLLDRADAQPKFDRLKATEFRIYESHLQASGSQYAVKYRFPLSD